MDLPNGETIAKWTGGFLVGAAAVWKIVERVFKKDSEEQTPVDYTRLRRNEDSRLKTALEEMDKRITRIEGRVVEERNFFLGQLKDSESRLSEQVRDIGDRMDNHYQGINERLDNLLRK